MKKLDNKTVFITGGLSGIGKACAIAAARQGANIAIASSRLTGIDEAMQDILQVNSRAIFVHCDVSVFKSAEAAIKQTVDAFSTLDIALNSSGITGEVNKVGDLSEEAWLKVININLNGIFNCMKHELVQMKKQGSGVIVNVSSVLGKVGFAYASHYVASKHGILGLTKAAAIEYATDGIRINALCPAFVDTPLLEKEGITEGSEIKNRITGLHPMKRLGNVDEVANAFMFLASDDSSFVTGSALDVDGGYLAR